ncbi:amidohydrolase family protein [Qiania dongpingensis]|uniref:Amidohydrolase n=1 Tax=Qiania dongpingensis TaxID=2763669 RepID=A0A7G9G6S7_9FIRM|nr:amidohydrolase family protein [Qiania dongpingensis]QNM06509.1 amidohydrolase [Qiania dongpingensis]
MKERFRAIDAHVHVIEQLKGIGYRGELRPIGKGKGRWANGEELRIIPEGWGESSFSYEELLRRMDANGVEKAVLLQGSLYGLQNEYSVEAVEKYPGRFAAMGSFDPYCLDAEEIMHRLIEECGCKGLKFEMSSLGGFMGYHSEFKIDGPQMKEVWKYAQERGLVISLDIGDRKSPSFQLDSIVKLAEKYSNIKIVIEHMFCAGKGERNYVERYLDKISSHSNIYVTLASVVTNCLQGPPYRDAIFYLNAACERIGSERIMWGSDLPITASVLPYEVLKNYIADYSGLKEKDLENVYYNTAKLVYGL